MVEISNPTVKGFKFKILIFFIKLKSDDLQPGDTSNFLPRWSRCIILDHLFDGCCQRSVA